MIGNFNDETNFPHKLSLINAQVSRLRKAFADSSSANIKSLKAQLHKSRQSGEFLGRLVGPLLETGFPLTKHVLKPLAKSVLIPSGLPAAVSPTDTSIEKKIFGSGMTTLVISNEDIDDIMKIVESFDDPVFAKQTKMKQKYKKVDFSVCY